jgi:hypothetical protein
MNAWSALLCGMSVAIGSNDPLAEVTHDLHVGYSPTPREEVARSLKELLQKTAGAPGNTPP